jgi:FkbM family methyltransferase
MLNIRQKIQTVANTFGYKISKVHPAKEFPLIDVLALVMQDRMRHNPDIFFVQIGAHDGQSSDPIHQLVKQHHWHGLLVEPQPTPFQKLTEGYQQESQLQFENAAIASEDGTATLYRVKEAGTHFPYWYYQIASLDRDRVIDVLEGWKAGETEVQLPAQVADLIEELPIPALSVKTLLSKHNVEQIDLLVIDTMGFDFEILKMFSFESIKPAVIHFEHNHLSSDDQAACLELLMDQGYSLAKVAVDTIAYLNAPTRRWGITNW